MRIAAGAEVAKEASSPEGRRTGDSRDEKRWYTEVTSIVGTVGAVVGLVTTGLPALATAIESISIRSRRRSELRHIRELLGLLGDIRKGGAGSSDLMSAVCAQIEAEIKSSLQVLSKDRAHREKMAAREHGLTADTGLSHTRRILLLYRPHGARAWIAHGVVYLIMFLAISLSAFGVTTDIQAGTLNGTSFWGVAVLLVSAFLIALPFGLMASRQRVRWMTGRPQGTA